MAANVSTPHAGATPGRHTGLRVAVGVLGLAALVIGVVLLFHPMAAARTLALLVALAFVVGGLLEMAVGWDDPKRGPTLLLGAILVLGGIVAVAWPGVTLLALAWITGLSLIVHGAARAGVAVVERHEVPNWGWFALAGAVNVIVGVLAIAWPKATVVVLALVLGIQIALFGLLLLVAAFVRFPTGGLRGEDAAAAH
jgi:uncharacterized membrane protein HdeD (DUF308 family)